MAILWCEAIQMQRPCRRALSLRASLFSMYEVIVREGGPRGFQVLNARRVVMCKAAGRPEVTTLAEDVVADLTEAGAAKEFGRRFFETLRSRLRRELPGEGALP